MTELKTVLDRVAERIAPRPDAFGRLARRRVARRRRHRIEAGAVAVLIAIAGFAGAVVAFRGTSPRVSIGSTVFREGTAAWRIRYPARWHFVSFGDQARTTEIGARLANFPVPGVDAGANGADSFLGLLSSFPSDGVMLQIWQSFRGFGIVAVEQRPDNSFPVSLANLHPIRRYVGGNEPVPHFGTILANGDDYGVAAWIGPHASAADRSALQSALQSWTFLPLREASVIGSQVDFYVLGRPDQYPVGSVLRFGSAELPPNPHGVVRPFYLVHAPQGFYAVAADHQGCSTVIYDANAQQFACPGGPRWSLDGTLVSNPDPARFGYLGHLDILMVRISLDGHVLASNEAFVPNVNADLQLTGSGPQPSPSHPGGAFQWCPDTANSLPPGPDAAAEAGSAALQFARAYAAGDEATARSLADDGAFDHASWSVSGSPDAISVQNAVAAQQDDLVTTGCGPEVAARTYAVTLDDGTDSASLDFTLYLIQRPDGWRVWGSY
ncbi:MAG: hypothetical protein M3Q23_11545 [Actinomycetota bacterium]|nr:hypothetical protein [Actinomycetota bacterium]